MIIRVAILTVSDRSSRGDRPDASGPALAEIVRAQGWQVIKHEIVPDEMNSIQTRLQAWADSGESDLILTTGGTGFAPRDVTPEATRAVVQRLTPGLDEAMRVASSQVTLLAMLSRAVSGIYKHSLIINLPGSPKGASENLEVILPVLEHAIRLLKDEEAGH